MKFSDWMLCQKIYINSLNIYVLMEPSEVKPFLFGMIHCSPSGDVVQYPQVMKDIFVVVPDQPAPRGAAWSEAIFYIYFFSANNLLKA